MNAKPPVNDDAGAAKRDPAVDPDEPTRMASPEMRPPATPGGEDRSRTGGTATGTGTFGDLAGLAEGPVQVLHEGDLLKERFVLETRLGTGGMGTVYKALDLRKQEAEDRNPYIAVKILNEDFRAHPESLRTLQRESKKAQSLAHPNIVTVYDFDRDGTSIYMTMEYLEGRPLDRITKSAGFKGLPLEQALEIINDVGEALSFAHKQGIVHCDFKPGNIFITETGPAKVIDFGIARAVKLGDDPHADATLFDAGSLGALTPAYASPEMLEEKEPDPRDDIYALACISYELISGRHPFGRMPANEARDNGLVPKQPANLNRRQWRALSNGLEFDRAKRTANVQSFIEELRATGGSGKVVGLVAAAIGVAAMGGAGLFFGLLQQSDDASTSGSGGEVAQVIDDAERPEIRANPGVSGSSAGDSEAQDTTVGGTAGEAHTAAGTETTPSNQGATEQSAPAQEALALQPGLSLDDIETFLHEVSCADLRYSIDSGAVALRGYSGSRAEVELLHSKIEALPAVSGVDSEIGSLDGALCAPLNLYAPYIRANRAEDHGLNVQARNRDGHYVENENLVVDLKLPSFDSYVYVDYYSIDGGVLHMLPNVAYTENLGSARIDVALGDEGAARTWSIAAPFGTEMIVVLSSPEPLFDNNREEVEFAESYLSALRERLDQIRRGAKGDQLSANVFFITTAPAQ